MDAKRAEASTTTARIHRHPHAEMIRRLPLILILLVTLGGCALAKGPPPATQECDTKQSILIRGAFVLAERDTETAIAFLDANPNHEHVRTWLGTGDTGKARARLVATLERLRPARHPPWNCNAQLCGSRAVFGIASMTRGTITFCPMFFNARNEGFDSRPGVIIHEVSHLAAGTQDIAYGRTAAIALARKQPDRAALNADNLEYFVEMLPGVARR